MKGCILEFFSFQQAPSNAQTEMDAIGENAFL